MAGLTRYHMFSLLLQYCQQSSVNRYITGMEGSALRGNTLSLHLLIDPKHSPIMAMFHNSHVMYAAY